MFWWHWNTFSSLRRLIFHIYGSKNIKNDSPFSPSNFVSGEGTLLWIFFCTLRTNILSFNGTLSLKSTIVTFILLYIALLCTYTYTCQFLWILPCYNDSRKFSRENTRYSRENMLDSHEITRDSRKDSQENMRENMLAVSMRVGIAG